VKRSLFFLFIPFWVSSIAQKQKLKEESQISIRHHKGLFRLFHRKQIDNFKIFDKAGREIEWVVYGEVTCKRYSYDKNDSIVKITTGCTWDYSKIDFIEFSFYDSIGRLSKKETWYYRNNQKDYLSNYRVFLYNRDNSLMKEIDYNDSNKIDKTVCYLYNHSNNIEKVDSDFNYNFTEKVHIYKTFNFYDSLKRIVYEIDSSDNNLLSREKYIYTIDSNATKTLRYDNQSDTSLWRSVDGKCSYKNGFLYAKEEKEVYYRGLREEPDTSIHYDKFIHLYNKNGVLQRVDHYHKDDLTKGEFILADYCIYKYY
jgi:hypothetical protein